MIKFVSGNMFETPADIRINTVNCVGAMGAGVALAFKNRFAAMFKDYRNECRKKTIRPGKPHVWTDYRIDGNITIINFPIKDHWKDPSEYKYIKSGLKWLRVFLKEKGSVSVTLPALGCGHGGLEWERVKRLIVEYLEDLDAQIYVFEPADTHQLSKIMQPEIKEELEEKNIDTVNHSDSNYPEYFRGKSSAPFYVKGDISIFNKNALVILPSRKMEQHEKEAVSICIDHIMNYDIVFIVGYSEGDRYILKKLLEAKRKVIVCIEEGILQFVVKKDLAESWDNTLVTVVSILKPSQKWARHNLKISTELKISMGNTSLITTYDPTWLTRAHANIHKLLNKSFFINYGSLSPDVSKLFAKIQANPISKDANGIPKLNILVNACLSNMQENR